MEVRIGTVHTGKEMRLELGADTVLDDLVAAVDGALSGQAPVLWLTDKDGDRHAVASEKIAWVEIETDKATKRVGFGPA
jgi:hypothetical protein